MQLCALAISVVPGGPLPSQASCAKSRGRARGRGRGRGRGRARSQACQPQAPQPHFALQGANASEPEQQQPTSDEKCTSRMAALLHASGSEGLIANAKISLTFDLLSYGGQSNDVGVGMEEAPLVRSLWSCSLLAASQHYSRREWAEGRVVKSAGGDCLEFQLRAPLSMQSTDTLMKTIHTKLARCEDRPLQLQAVSRVITCHVLPIASVGCCFLVHFEGPSSCISPCGKVTQHSLTWRASSFQRAEATDGAIVVCNLASACKCGAVGKRKIPRQARPVGAIEPVGPDSPEPASDAESNESDVSLLEALREAISKEDDVDSDIDFNQYFQSGSKQPGAATKQVPGQSSDNLHALTKAVASSAKYKKQLVKERAAPHTPQANSKESKEDLRAVQALRNC